MRKCAKQIQRDSGPRDFLGFGSYAVFVTTARHIEFVGKATSKRPPPTLEEADVRDVATPQEETHFSRHHHTHRGFVRAVLGWLVGLPRACVFCCLDEHAA